MTKAEFNQAYKRAEERRDKPYTFTLEFDGFALPDFQPVVCTLDQLADLIRWQSFEFGGGIDASGLAGIWLARRKFIVVGVAELQAAA